MLFFIVQVALATSTSTSSGGAFFSDAARQDAPSDAVLVYTGYNISAVLHYDGQDVDLTTAEVLDDSSSGVTFVQPPAGGWPVGTDLVVDLKSYGGDTLDSLSFQSDGHVAEDVPVIEATYTASDWMGDRPFRNIDITVTSPNGHQPWDRMMIKQTHYWSIYDFDATRTFPQKVFDGEVSPECFSILVLSEAGVVGEEQLVCPDGDPPDVDEPAVGDTGDDVVAAADSSCSTAGSLSSFLGLFSLVFAFRRRQ